MLVLRHLPPLAPPCPRLPPSMAHSLAHCRMFSLSPCLNRNKAEIYSSHQRPTAVLDPEVRRQVEGGVRPRRPAAIVAPCPRWTRAIAKSLEAMAGVVERLPEYVAAGDRLARHVRHRKPPLEGADLKARERRVEERLVEEFGQMLEQEARPVEVRRREAVLRKQHLHSWAPIEFDSTAAVAYLVTRAAGEFATLATVFAEIKQAMPDFQPRTLFDLGSGVTTGLWAFRAAFGEATEVFCVDPSKAMNDLSRAVEEQGGAQVPGRLNFRLHNPSQVGLQYQLVLASSTLMELGSARERLEAVHSLWRRVEDGGVLVIVEGGTNAAFQLVVEARDYLEQVSTLARQGEVEAGEGHVVAPCPHDAPCPRFALDTVPCSFPVRWTNFALPGIDSAATRQGSFSYVAFRKGVREVEARPRLVEESVKTKGAMYCRLCTPEGRLQEVLCKKSRDPGLYEVAKRLAVGQQLPVTLQPWREGEGVGTPWMKRKRGEGE